MFLNWISEEFLGVKFGDKRLSERFLKLMNNFANFLEGSIPDACSNSASLKAAYRFFGNPKVDMQSIHNSHQKALIEKLSQHRLVLNIQDTTKLNYFPHKSKQDRGYIGTGCKSSQSLGYWLHTGIVVSTAGVPLGISSHKLWSRAKVKNDNHEPQVKSESCKWIEGKNESIALLDGGAEIIQIADREADIFDFLYECIKDKFSFLVRSKSNRIITLNSNETAKKKMLHEYMNNQPIICTDKLSVESNSKRKAATVEVNIRTGCIVLSSPASRTRYVDETNQRQLLVNAILVTSSTKVNGQEINWLLLTDREVVNTDEIKNLVRYYTLRWHVEIFFKTIKSGCKIEECRLSTISKISTYLMMQSIIAVRVMMLTYCGQNLPNMPASMIIPKTEWEKIRRIIYPKGSMAPINAKIKDVAKQIAEFGGFIKGRKRRPGVTTTWRGWRKIQTILDGIEQLSYAI